MFGAMKFKRHFFVCLTDRPPFAKPSCAPRGSRQIFQALAEAVEARGLAGEVAVTSSGCLGPCDSGPSIVVYPEGVWYHGVRIEDVPEIVENHAAGGIPVERLRYTWPGA
jgi:(2Fe-2S) ferredoxin